MKLKILILSVVVFLLSIFLLVRFYTNFKENSINEKISNTRALIKTGKSTLATYDSTITVLKRRGNVVSKSINYSYIVNGKTYSDSKNISEMPSEVRFPIIYLPSDPDIHSENPKKDLEYLEKELKDKDSESLPWILFIVSITVFFITRKFYLKDLREEYEERKFFQEQVSLSKDINSK